MCVFVCVCVGGLVGGLVGDGVLSRRVVCRGMDFIDLRSAGQFGGIAALCITL